MAADILTTHVEGWNDNYISGRANRYPYDNVVSFVLRHFGNAKAEERSGICMLDLGCGGGNHLKFIKDEGFDAYGVDGSAEAVRLACELIGEPECRKVLVSYFHNMPFADGFFDCVIDRQSLGHNCATDIPRIIVEIERVLRPGGLYFGHVFGRETTSFQYGKDLGKGDFSDFTSGNFKRSHLVHAFDEMQIANFFASFELISLKRLTTTDIINHGDLVVVYEINARKKPERK